MSKHILMIVTSHDRINDEHQTGIWFEEFSIPYNKFLQQGYKVTVTSPAGGDAPLDANSLQDYQATEENENAKAALKGLPALDDSYQASDYDAVFFPGGHGTMFDLPEDQWGQTRLILVIKTILKGPNSFEIKGATTAWVQEVERSRKLEPRAL